jgi:glutamate 5-kinase
MHIVPIINENDAVSTSDIELEDNYPLALNVANISNADIILIKSDNNGSYVIQACNGMKAKTVNNENELLKNIDDICQLLTEEPEKRCGFPNSIQDIVYE